MPRDPGPDTGSRKETHKKDRALGSDSIRTEKAPVLPRGGPWEARHRAALVRWLDRDQPCSRSSAAVGNLLVDYSLARHQDRDLMRRGRHSSLRECRSRQPLLSIGWSQRHKLVRRDRKAHDFIGWKFCSSCASSAQHETCSRDNRQSVPHDDLHSLTARFPRCLSRSTSDRTLIEDTGMAAIAL